MLKHYNDYFSVPIEYRAEMTRERINVTPDAWLDFYPHATFAELLNTLLNESQAVWLTGNYGTGKSNAALVLQKLFMDDLSRVDKWFDDNSSVLKNKAALYHALINARNAGTLVVYDYNASGVGPHEEFLVRLEKGVLSALQEYGYTAPAKANLDVVIDRLRREGEHFFRTRDSIQGQMKSLKADICTVEQLITHLQAESVTRYDKKQVQTPTHFLEDVQTVFHKDNIYLSIDVPTFRTWIASILTANNLKRVIYIFDEFSDFIDANSSQLKTFEEVTEAPDVNHFYLMPVTHKEPIGFRGENAPGAKRTRDRFIFRNLTMPNDIAFRLAAHAMKPVQDPELQREWKTERNKLWNSIQTVVNRFETNQASASYVDRQSFYDILPIQPMTAFLLKFLSEHARSNQRSIFGYLLGSAEGREFQEFIATGGPAIPSAQFLTPDYLWKFFMENEKAGETQEIKDIRLEYNRIIQRQYRGYNQSNQEIRVLKTVMLFSLLARLAPEGHERLAPTVENVMLSFQGDATMLNVQSTLKDMAENKHCFSIVDGKIDLYASSIGGGELKKKSAELTGKFYELTKDPCEKAFNDRIKAAKGGFSAKRFEMRVTDVGHLNLTNLNTATRERFSRNLAKDTASICLWFVVCKDKSEQLLVDEKANQLLNQLKEHRIIVLTFPDNTFCKNNVQLWDEYVRARAQYELENNASTRAQMMSSFQGIENRWLDEIKSANTRIELRYYASNAGVACEFSSWAQLKEFLPVYVAKNLEACPDNLTNQVSAFSNKGMRQWALAGIRFSGSGQMNQLVKALDSKGIEQSDSWFDNNPNHALTQIRRLLEKKYTNTVGKGSELSLRKVYIELERAPYGFSENCLSAFTLGFCSAWMLQKNCQWTNGQKTESLDAETLAEIIEATVAGKTDKEKFICRLSKEAKAFAKHTCHMFGKSDEHTEPLTALGMISATVEANSTRVPLWVLADYVRTVEPEAENVARVFDHLCTAIRISSKGSAANRNEAINAVGELILADSTLINKVAGYTRSEIYLIAFQSFVDHEEPELKELATRVQDQSHEYCQMILKEAAPTAGWLWNKQDISALIQKTRARYRFMVTARDLLQLSGYASYSDIFHRLYAKITSFCVPYSFVGQKYPAIKLLAEGLAGNQDDENMLLVIEDCRDIFHALYNDPAKKAAVELVKERTGDLSVSDSELLSMLEGATAKSDFSATMSSEAYVQLIRKAVNENHQNVLKRNLLQEWCRITGAESIAEWHQDTRLPIWTALDALPNKDELIHALKNADSCSIAALERSLTALAEIQPVEISDCQAAFLKQIIPAKYKKLGIQLSSILRYLEGKFGKDPERWLAHPDIDPFVKEQYQAELAPNVLRKLKESNADTVKRRVLDLARTDPDIGLKLLEILSQ